MIFKKLQHTLLGALVFGTLSVGGCTNTKPPDLLLAETEAEIDKAKDLGAQEHAPIELLDAEGKLARAKSAINVKQYLQAETMLEQAMVDAEHAAIKSRSVKAKSAASTVDDDIQTLRKELEKDEEEQEPGETYGEYEND